MKKSNKKRPINYLDEQKKQQKKQDKEAKKLGIYLIR